MLTRNLLIGLLLTAFLSGCTAPDATDASADTSGLDPLNVPFLDVATLAQASSEGSGPSAAPPGRGSADTHGAPTYEEGDISSAPANSGGRLLARVEQTILIQNDIGGAERLRYDGAIRAGNLAVKEWEHGGYRLVATLIGEGATVADARKAFDAIRLEYDESFQPGSLEFGFRVVHDSFSSGTLGESPVTAGPLFRSIDAVLYVPASDMLRLEMSSTSGDILFEGLSSAQIDAASTTGDLKVAESHANALFFQSSEGDMEAFELTGVDLYMSRTLGHTLLHYVDVKSAVVDVADDATFRHSSLGDVVLNAEDVEGNAAMRSLVADVYSIDLDIIPEGSGTFEVTSIDDASVVFESADDSQYDVLTGSLTRVDVRVPGTETVSREAPAGYDYGLHVRDPSFGTGQAIRAVVYAEGVVTVAA